MKTDRIAALRTEIRTAEHAALTAGPAVTFTTSHDRTPVTTHSPGALAQARLDALCAELGQLTDDA